jgi:histidyl-tRNA synthetase
MMAQKNDPKPDQKQDARSNPKARLPRGLADRGPAEIAATRAMIETIRKVYELYGFEPVETPAFEYTDALGKFLPDQDRPNEGVFSFQDDDEQWLSLRYDLTAPLARYVAENFDHLPKPYRSYRAGWVFRNEKPGPGRFRQFMQFDADTVGSASMAADAEICMMAADTMDALGLRGHYVVKVWNRKSLDGILEAAGAPPEKHLVALRSVDKRDRVGLYGVQQLLGKGRWESGAEGKGDFTKGAELSIFANNFVTASITPTSAGYTFSAEELISYADLKDAESAPNRPFDFDEYRELIIANLRGRPFPAALDSGLSELKEIEVLIKSSGYQDRIVIDKTVVRGLEYYTGPVYEVELTFPTTGDDGKPVRFGSVGGGGRYDGLVARFRGEPVPATGFSIGVSRLLAALTHLGKVATKPEPGPVIVTVFDKDRIADYQRMASTLRSAGIRAELYLGQGKFGPQMKYADRRGSPCVVIQGSDEKAKGEVQIKDLILGAELAGLSKERDDYLQKQAAAQFAVPEADLVAKVREVLARHDVKWG